jgi:Domain of unknown function (DUF3291)
MPLISVTRLRIRSIWFMPAFFFYTLRANWQARAAMGNSAVQLLPDAQRTYWTCTQWSDLKAMRAYVGSGAHREAMRRLAHWCDEASVVHWEQTAAGLPGWDEAHRRMQQDGRPSKVNHPSAAHLAYQIPQPETVIKAAKLNGDAST